MPSLCQNMSVSPSVNSPPHVLKEHCLAQSSIPSWLLPDNLDACHPHRPEQGPPGDQGWGPGDGGRRQGSG